MLLEPSIAMEEFGDIKEPQRAFEGISGELKQASAQTAIAACWY